LVLPLLRTGVIDFSVAADGMRKAGMPDWNVRIVSELLDYFASGAAATVSRF
jgi:hypothetical protein